MRTLAFTALVLVWVPVAGLCQSQGGRLPFSRGDVTVATGWFGASHASSNSESVGPNWSSSLFKGLGAGFYWSDHLKTEIEAAWPGTTKAYGYSSTRLADGSSGYSYDDHSFRTFTLSVGQSYQFGRNSLVHPFVGAGLDVTRERDRTERSTETSRGRVATSIADTAAVRARPFVSTGFKSYFSERAFFRGELKVDFSGRPRAIDQMTWKAGVGVDF